MEDLSPRGENKKKKKKKSAERKEYLETRMLAVCDPEKLEPLWWWTSVESTSGYQKNPKVEDIVYT